MSKMHKLLGKKRKMEEFSDLHADYFLNKHRSKLEKLEKNDKMSEKLINVYSRTIQYFSKIQGKDILESIMFYLSLKEVKDLYSTIGNKRLRDSFHSVVYKYFF